MNVLKRIFNYFKVRFVSSSVLDNPLQAPTAPSSVQENTRDKETIKRVAKSFEAQQEQMQARALKPHDPTCKDPLTCTQRVCFVREPDKIVSDPYVVNMRKMRKTPCRKKITS